MKKLLLILIIGLMLVTPVCAEKVTAKVDDKGLIYNKGLSGTLHTEYGWILVKNSDYNNVKINDTIIYDTDLDSFWIYWDIEVVK